MLFPLDLSVHGQHANQIDVRETNQFSEYLFDFVLKGRVGIGGYLEKRNFYERSKHFESGFAAFRNIHLGIDVWTTANTPIYAPLDAKVHSYAYNEGDGNYGGTIILQHQWQGETIHSLYGHLSKQSLENISGLERVKASQLVGWLGTPQENGNWPPHLHFQLIKNMQQWKGDYPGVCSENDLPSFKANCPNPMQFLGFQP